MTPEALAKSGTETAHQQALFCWIALNRKNYPDFDMIFSVPNGGLRDKVTASRMKAEGLKRGVPDIFVSFPRGGYHGLYVEMKKAGGVVSPEQNIFLDRADKLGYATVVCYSWDEAARYIIEYHDLQT